MKKKMKFFYRFTEIYQSPKSIQPIYPLANQIWWKKSSQISYRKLISGLYQIFIYRL